MIESGETGAVVTGQQSRHSHGLRQRQLHLVIPHHRDLVIRPMLMCYQETRHSLEPQTTVGYLHCVSTLNRECYKENRSVSRTSKVQETIVPEWMKNQHWQDRVNDMCNKPNKPTVAVQSAQPSGIYQSDYGKQTGCAKHSKTPLMYGPGEGSRLDKYVDCFHEKYEMASWDGNFGVSRQRV